MPVLGKKDFKYKPSDAAKDRTNKKMINTLTNAKLEANLSSKLSQKPRKKTKASVEPVDDFAHLKL